MPTANANRRGQDRAGSGGADLDRAGDSFEREDVGVDAQLVPAPLVSPDRVADRLDADGVPGDRHGQLAPMLPRPLLVERAPDLFADKQLIADPLLGQTQAADEQ